MACALAQYACRRGHSATYQPRTAPARGAAYSTWQWHFWKVAAAAGQDGRAAAGRLGDGGAGCESRADLLEIIDDRGASKATIITSHLPIEYWHAWVGDADRRRGLTQRDHRVTLTAESLRQKEK
ncbi:ATP-binding protein [Bradyrhizobium sp. RT9a]|uniref:ATP-binding protein n=1 Tax=Bradyrhizobium sp. RT9a TaxID=3156384 RepID=UPI003395EDE6